MNISRRFSVSFGLRIISAALTFLVTFLYARLLGIEEYGEYIVFVSAVSIIYFIATGALSEILSREVSVNRLNHRYDLVNGVITFAVGKLLFLLIVQLAIYNLFFPYFAPGYSGNLSLIAWCSCLFWGLSSLVDAVLRGFGHYIAGQFGELLFRPLFLITSLPVVMRLNNSFFVAECPAEVAFLVANLLYLLSSISLYLLLCRDRFFFRPIFKTKEWLAGSVFSSGSAILIKSSFSVVFLLIAYLQGPSFLGIYRVAFQVAMFSGIGLVTAKVLILPALSRAVAVNRGDSELLGVLFRSISTTLLFTLPLCIPLIVWPGLILEYSFGLEFASGALSVRLIALSVLVNASFGPMDSFLQAARLDKFYFYSTAIRSAVFVFLAFLSIEILGFSGAALAQLISVSVWCCLLCFFFVKFWRFR